MGVGNFIEKILTKLGDKNKATYAVVAIATVKGICRPIFTMMDKNEDLETKKYAAIREGLTEAVAIPVYIASGKLMEKFADKLAVPKNFMDKKLYKRHLAGDTSSEVKNAFEVASELAENNLPKMKGSLNFLGVCAAALLIIPALCSVAIKPVMSALKKRGQEEKLEKVEEAHEIAQSEVVAEVNSAKKLDINTAQPIVLNSDPSFTLNNSRYKSLNSFATMFTSGMKVGGV